MKPEVRSPNANVTPNASLNHTDAGKRSAPPNLLGVKDSRTPGVPPRPGGKQTTTGLPVRKESPSGNVTGGSPNAPKGTPPNLVAPRPSETPGLPESQSHQAAGGPTPKPTDNLLQGGQKHEAAKGKPT